MRADTGPGTDDGAGPEPRPNSGTKARDTRTKLLEGALRTLIEQGIARTIAAAAWVNQALVFYHFGSVDELLGAACHHGAEQRVSRYRPPRLAAVTSLADLIDTAGRARAVAASFVGLELYEGVDQQGASRALDALEQLAVLAAVLEELGPLAQRAVRRRLRHTGRT